MTRKSDSAPPNGLGTLDAEDIELWIRVTRTVKPRRKRTTSPPAVDDDPDTPPRKVRLSTPVALPRALKHTIFSPPPMELLKRREKNRISRGHIERPNSLDMHGMTQQQAHSQLYAFLLNARARGAGVVLVVTGKGRTYGTAETDGLRTMGVLRRMVPMWLQSPAFRGLIFGFEEAALQHGGSGALYVRLRKQR